MFRVFTNLVFFSSSSASPFLSLLFVRVRVCVYRISMSSEQGVSSSTANNSTNFQTVRQNTVEHLGHTFDNSMQMFSIKQQQQQQQQQQPMASPVTGTIYTGPPAKYLNNNNNGYMRAMVPQQKYMPYNGSNMAQQQQQRRPYNNNNNNNGADNATNDSVK